MQFGSRWSLAAIARRRPLLSRGLRRPEPEPGSRSSTPAGVGAPAADRRDRAAAVGIAGDRADRAKYIKDQLDGGRRRRSPSRRGTTRRRSARSTMVNLIATIPGARKDRIVIAGHYDTKLFREFRFVGANDGGSSAAFLIELARVLKAAANAFTIELLFLDGEEARCRTGAAPTTPTAAGTTSTPRKTRRLARHAESARAGRHDRRPHRRDPCATPTPRPG